MPVLFFLARKISREVRYTMFFTFFFAFFIMQQSQQSRFYIPILAVLAIGAGKVWDVLMREKGALRHAGMILLTGFLVFHLGIFYYRAKPATAAMVGVIKPADYLARHERSYKAYAYLTDHLRAGETMFSAGEPRHFYSPEPHLHFDSVPLRQELEKKGQTMEEYILENKFNYVLVDDKETAPISLFLAKNGYRAVYSYTFREKADFSYTIYKLGN